MRPVIVAVAAAILAWTAVPLSASAAPAAMSPEKAAKSKECSTQADAKGLHGKARKRFRSACKRGAASKT